MPAVRLSTSKPSKHLAFPSNAPRRFSCPAWWCDSTFGRPADMTKHVNAEHFGKRSYCTICSVVMKQCSNMRTHMNGHLSNHCTVCSCGRGFTDPSAYTRHREVLGHAKGATHGMIRPTIVEGVKVQHIAGLTLDLAMISNPSFIPPLFDTSYHFKGMPKPKGQEKYNPDDYIELHESPTTPVAQTTAPLFTAGVPVQYHGNEPAVPVETEIQVERLGFVPNYSYDVELLQEAQVPAQPEYRVTTYPSLAFDYTPWLTPSPSFGISPEQNHFEGTMSRTYAPYLPQTNFYGQAYHPALPE